MTQGNLLSFVESVTDGSRLRVESDLGGGFVRLRVSEAERRQAKQDIRCVEDAVIELLRNARDAHARNIFVASARSGSVRHLVLIDDGDGIPFELWNTVFEPRVTSKLNTMHFDDWGVHGRGMALYSIRENSLSAEICTSQPEEGTALECTFDCNALAERTDQSSLPELCLSDSGLYLGPGPHNIPRAVAEFALANKDVCTVYYGSPVEIAATVREFSLGHREALYSPLVSAEVSPFDIVRSVKTAAELKAAANILGLEFSERSARRILSHEISAVSPILETLKRDGKVPSPCEVDLNQDFRGLKIHPDDMSDFKRDIMRAFEELADRYYLTTDAAPQVRVTKDGIRILIPTTNKD